MIGGAIRFKLGLIPLVLFLLISPSVTSESIAFNDKYIVPFINYINSVDVDVDDDKEDKEVKMIIVIPALLL